MQNEVRMWLGGTELELKPISAMQRLEAKKNSRELIEKLSADKQDKQIIESAFILAEGLFDGENRKFTGGEEVLSMLSTEEILEAAVEYKIPDMPKPDDDEREMKADRNTVHRDEIHSSDTKKREAADSPNRQNLRINTKRHYSETENNAESPDFQSESGKLTRSRDTERKQMESVSDYFERDSRRYDSTYIRY